MPPPRLTAEGAGGTPCRVYQVRNSSVEQIAHVSRSQGSKCYWLLVASTREDTDSTLRLLNLTIVLGVAQPSALQMSASEALCANAQEEATLRVE